MNNYSAEIATNRFGLGARAGELTAAGANPQKWLFAQLQPIKFAHAETDMARAYDLIKRFDALRKNDKKEELPNKKNNKNRNNNMQNEGAASISQSVDDDSKDLRDLRKEIGDFVNGLEMESIRNAVLTPNSFSVRLLDFFSNHFSVTAQGNVMRVIAPLLERDAIAPNLVGQFEDMLLAVEQHPTMLVYLNNEKSIGPDSTYGKKSKKGLNENLGREILELHTLGVHGGYTQTDVRELAMAITGWSVVALGKKGTKEQGVGFVFRDGAHQPGERKILDKIYAQKGIKKGEAILKDLANHPATAKHISFKLARHFVADVPTDSLVKAMTKTWAASKGNIKAVLKTMLEHADSWLPEQQKYKSPREFVISTLRAIDGIEPLKLEKLKIVQSLTALGQQPFNAGSPAGFGDLSSAWDGAEALMARIEWVNQVAAHIKVQAMPLMEAALGSQARELTQKLVKRAESRQQALVLVLMSPEFQRR